jgi:hypothetical protein
MLCNNQGFARLLSETYDNIGSLYVVLRARGKSSRKNQIQAKPLETTEPIGRRVLICKDEDKEETKGGIQLPEKKTDLAEFAGFGQAAATRLASGKNFAPWPVKAKTPGLLK